MLGHLETDQHERGSGRPDRGRGRDAGKERCRAGKAVAET